MPVGTLYLSITDGCRNDKRNLCCGQMRKDSRLKRVEPMKAHCYIMPYFVFFLSLFCSGGLSEAAFSNMGIAARSLGMGGAFTAVADDASATLWNPAGLVQLGHFELSSMYLNYPVPNVSTQFISAATPLLWDSSLGLSLLFTGEAGLYQEQTIAFSYGQDLYNFIPLLPVAVGFSIKQLGISFTGSDPQDPLFKLGSRVKQTTGTLGLIYQVLPSFKLAVVADNLTSPSLSLNPEEALEEQETNKLFPSFHLGGAYTRHQGSSPSRGERYKTEYTFSFEYVREQVTETVRLNQLCLGAELWLLELGLPGDSALAVRGGANLSGKSTTNYSLGAGSRFAFGQKVGAQLDYAFSYYDPFNSIGNHHRFSFSLAF